MAYQWARGDIQRWIDFCIRVLNFQDELFSADDMTG